MQTATATPAAVARLSACSGFGYHYYHYYHLQVHVHVQADLAPHPHPFGCRFSSVFALVAVKFRQPGVGVLAQMPSAGLYGRRFNAL